VLSEQILRWLPTKYVIIFANRSTQPSRLIPPEETAATRTPASSSDRLMS
jgi:hypothetical protein